MLANCLLAHLRKTKVNLGHNVALTTETHQELVRLEVAVDEPFAVHELNPVDHLVAKHEDNFVVNFLNQ